MNLKTSVDALPHLESKEVIELFSKYNVLSERELDSRLEIYLEQYCKTVYTEANLTLEMAKTMIFPAAMRYQNELASTCANLKLVGYEFDTDTLERHHRAGEILQDSISRAADGDQQSVARRCAGVGQVLLKRRAARDGDGSQIRRRAGRLGGRRPVAAADLPGNAVHQVTIVKQATAARRFVVSTLSCFEIMSGLGFGPPKKSF